MIERVAKGKNKLSVNWGGGVSDQLIAAAGKSIRYARYGTLLPVPDFLVPA